MPDDEYLPWGKYAPLKKTLLLRFLIAVGLGREAFRAKIIETWKKNLK